MEIKFVGIIDMDSENTPINYLQNLRPGDVYTRSDTGETYIVNSNGEHEIVEPHKFGTFSSYETPLPSEFDSSITGLRAVINLHTGETLNSGTIETIIDQYKDKIGYLLCK